VIWGVDGLAEGLNLWVAVVSGIVAAIAGILGLPLAWTKARNAMRAGSVVTRKILPERGRLAHRGDEITKVLALLAAGEFLVSIEGTIGVGKSAVQLEVAHRFAEFRGRRRRGKPHGLVLWLDAGNHSFDLLDLARALALATDDQSLTAAAADEKAQALRVHLAAHPAVLVIDNLRLTASGAQQLVEFLRSLPTGSIALVSANTPRRLPGARFWLEELQEQATRDLLVTESKRHGVPEIENADPATMARIHRLVGGNPRAIELFVLACARGSRGLNDQLRQLEEGKAELSDELYDAVWDTVSATGKRILAVGAYLEGGANLEQLRVASGLPLDDVDQALDQLWGDGLLTSQPEQGERRYSCPAAFRSFVAANVADDQFAGIAQRLAVHFVERFRRDWEDAAGATPHIDAIRTVIGDLHRRGEHQACFDLFEVTLDLFFTLGLFDDRIALGRIAYESATLLGRPDQRSLALSVVSSTHAVRGEHAAAQQAAQEGLAIAREAGSNKEIARQLRCLGFALFRAGRPDDALTVIANDRENAERMARDAGDLHNMIDIQSLDGAIHWHLGRLAEAEVITRRFLDACDQLPWERGKAYAVRDLAELVLMRRDFRDAGMLLDQACDIADRYRDRRQQARIALSTARLHLFRGRPGQARKAADAARDAARRLSLVGESAEAEAVHRAAVRASVLPWRYLFPARPQTRYTDYTVGGD
jgi:tetratricopeptide (TPR) repeat protein